MRTLPLLVLTLIACGNSVTVDPKGAQLPAPWTSLNLPVGPGEVVEVSATEIDIHYSNHAGSQRELAVDYVNALHRAGWELDPPQPMPNTIVARAHRGGQELTMMVVQDTKDTYEIHIEVETP